MLCSLSFWNTRYLGCSEITRKPLPLPRKHVPHTPELPLRPLPAPARPVPPLCSCLRLGTVVAAAGTVRVPRDP